MDIWLDRHVEALERYVTTADVPARMLSCRQPVPATCRVDTADAAPKAEYRVIPDARRPRAYEIHSIDRVTASLAGQPGSGVLSRSIRWHIIGRGGGRPLLARVPTPGGCRLRTEDRRTCSLSLVDTDFAPSAESDWTVDVMTTCLNPRQLPFGGGQPKFQLGSGGPLQPIACLTPPTRTCRPSHPEGMLWRLISHLTLNHLSLAGPKASADPRREILRLMSPDASAEPLREILKLYDVADSTQSRNLIDGLLAVRAGHTVGRPGGSGSSGVCRGLEVALLFDEGRFTGSGLYLFGAVLERFLGMYSSLNSFTRTVVATSGSETKMFEWPARAGDVVFL